MNHTVIASDHKIPSVQEKENKYLTFSLGIRDYGLEILKVREIIGYIDKVLSSDDMTQITACKTHQIDTH